MLCKDAVTKYWLRVPIQSHSEIEVLFGIIECMCMMEGLPQYVHIDREICIINSGLLFRHQSMNNVKHTLRLNLILFSQRECYLHVLIIDVR